MLLPPSPHFLEDKNRLDTWRALRDRRLARRVEINEVSTLFRDRKASSRIL